MGTLRNTSCVNPLAQGANKVWRLFSIDDIWYNEEEERWVMLGLRVVRRHLTFINLYSLRVAFLFCLPQQGIPSHLAPCTPATRSCLLPASERKHSLSSSRLFPSFGNAGRPAWLTSQRRSLIPLLGMTNKGYEHLVPTYTEWIVGLLSHSRMVAGRAGIYHGAPTRSLPSRCDGWWTIAQ